MNNISAQREIKWNPGHFPAGTVVLLSDSNMLRERGGQRELTVQHLVRNGINSYVFVTGEAWAYLENEYDRQNQVIGQRMAYTNLDFNIAHVGRIVKRGTGPVVVDPDQSWDGKTLEQRISENYQRMTARPDQLRACGLPGKTTKTHYVGGCLDTIIRYVLSQMGISNRLQREGHCLDSDKLRHLIHDQSWCHRLSWSLHERWYSMPLFVLPKKRMNKFIRTNINRCLSRVKVEQRAYDEMMAKMFEDDWNEQFDRDYPEFNMDYEEGPSADPEFEEQANEFGFKNLMQADGRGGWSPVCSQCKCHVMPNRGAGPMCDRCEHEFILECEHDHLL